MAVVKLCNGILQGLAADTKPTTYPNGTIFFVSDTGGIFMYLSGAWVSISSASGEANTASNLGAGQGWYKTKVGVDLQFRSLTATSSKIALANNTNDVGIDVTEANLTLGNLGGTLGIAKGGTGQTTASAGFDALSGLTAVGDLIVGGASGARSKLAIGTANQLLRVNSGATALEWASTLAGLTLDSTNTISSATSLPTVTIAKGGTGQTTATEGFDALAPTTTAGDTIYNNGSDNIRLAVGNSNLGSIAGIPARQVLTVNSAGNAPTWNDPQHYPSSGRIWGLRQGFVSGAVNASFGQGLLNNITAGNGTGSAVAFGVDTTDGPRNANATGTNNTFARGGWWAGQVVARKYNPTLTIRFRLAAAQTSSNAMLYIGFINVTAQPTAGTSMLATMLNTKIGVLFGFRPADTTWMIMSNNAQATATYTACTGLPSSGATDATAHTLSISLNDTVPNINWSFDGVAQTAITDTTNNVPPSTTMLNPIMMIEAQSATSLTLNERWSQLSEDAP